MPFAGCVLGLLALELNAEHDQMKIKWYSNVCTVTAFVVNYLGHGLKMYLGTEL